MITDAARAVRIIDEVARRGGLGLKRSGAELVGPCPRFGGDDRFAVSPRKVVFLCRGCGAKSNVIEFVQHVDGVGFGDAIRLLTNTERIATPPPKIKAEKHVVYETERRAQALSIWNGAKPIARTLAEIYLHRPGLKHLPGDDVLRSHPACPFRSERLPCLIPLFTDTRTNESRAIMRTALAPDGTKIERLACGSMIGSAVKLTPDGDVTEGLTMSEGVETVLAAMQLGFRPAWALGSAGAIKTFLIIAGVEALTIINDNDGPDQNGRRAGQEAASDYAQRWVSAGREVYRIIPRRPDSDMADIVTMGGRHG